MTDADARKRIEGTIEGLIEARGAPWPTEEMRARYERGSADDIEAMRHALQAISDRAEMVREQDAMMRGTKGGHASRRHMRGEP